ncbi:MAG: nucleotide exchange factor GrpE [Anaerorhabdus sp.]
MKKNKDELEKEECCKEEGCDCTAEKEKTEEERLQNEIEKLKEELNRSKNDYYKVFADTENLKKRLQNDADTLRKYRIQPFAQEILSVLDNFERVLQIQIKDEDAQSVVNGVQMIYMQLKNALENEGVTPIECVDQKFDPNIHQALVTEKKEGIESGIILEEIQKGYKLKDRVIRASLVKVSE